MALELMKRPKIKFFLLFLILWAFGFLSWEWWNSYPKVRLMLLAPEKSLSGKLDSILHQAIEEYRLPGVSLALVKDGRVIYLKAFGYQNLKTKVPLHVGSIIPVASVSKLFTALTVANTAISLGKKATDQLQDSILSSFPQFTFYQFLEHRSGLKDRLSFHDRILGRSNLSLAAWGTDYLTKANVNEAQDQPMRYLDLNYDLLGFWLEKRTDEQFHDLSVANIFGPAGMDQSDYNQADRSDSIQISGYQHTFLWKRLEENQLKLKISPSPSSGLMTSTRDMSLALIHLLRDDMGNFQYELDWLKDPENDNFFGFQKIRMLDADWIGHYGGQAGYSSFFFYSKNEDLGIFIFFNLKDPANYRLDLSKKILEQVLQH